MELLGKLPDICGKRPALAAALPAALAAGRAEHRRARARQRADELGAPSRQREAREGAGQLDEVLRDHGRCGESRQGCDRAKAEMQRQDRAADAGGDSAEGAS